MYKVYKIMYVYKCMMYIYAHTHMWVLKIPRFILKYKLCTHIWCKWNVSYLQIFTYIYWFFQSPSPPNLIIQEPAQDPHLPYVAIMLDFTKEFAMSTFIIIYKAI